MSTRATVTINEPTDRYDPCSIAGCGNNAHWSAKGGHGYCNSHLYRFKRHGDPLAGRIPPGEAERYLREVAFQYTGDECLIWPYARNSAGYGHLSLNGRNQLVSRLVCDKVNGWSNLPWDEAAHSCGNGHLGCCAGKHLRWASAIENAADMVAHGNSQRGERMHMSKLTDDAVREIRASTLPRTELAERFGVTPSNISYIKRGKTWRHVQ
jgi:hypothetical protein